ncbi:parp-type zinc finger-containing protein c2a9.07c [Acrodontium crateriforme]|uniref:Parp-type zinc finger-containing protein c2a9.07c n=1 Tax=Acrodontium crateriforme TaxID=150365 RepID=A0AAQ3M6P9_9PEZI|nr:parp-type zinc finger-containing protein c2a9.07c [Acrodontium crateriforme]
MPAYRLDVATTNRAGCQATECKKSKTKIAKGELRQAVFVTINEHDGWKYRHWGCTTPDIFQKWKQTCEGNMDLVDGYDELPEELQVKVKRAFEQGHVDDEDWKGDIECNRWTGKNTPMFLTEKQKAARDAAVNGKVAPEKGAKKRSRAKAADDADEDDEKPTAKKARGKKGSKAAANDKDEDSTSLPPAKKTNKSKKVKAEENEDGNEEVETASKPKKGRKAKTNVNYAEDDKEMLADEKPTKKTASKRKSSKKVSVEDDE